MKLSELLSPYLPTINLDLDVLGLASDHRLIKPGYAFIVLHEKILEFIPGALKNGATVILYASELHLPDLPVPTIAISNLQGHLSAIASRFYHEPFQDLSCIGITGTNGKTTVAYLLMQALSYLNEKTAYIGTLGVGDMQTMRSTGMTTPGPIELQEIATHLLAQGKSCVAMEVSSHGLDQGRVAALPFEQAIFTNLTHDHLDYHPSFEHYAAAKAKLFAFPALKSIIVNYDDAHAPQMIAQAPLKTKIYTYGLNEQADVSVKTKHWTLEGMNLLVLSPWGMVDLKASLLGDFNVYNILAVFTALMARGYDLEQVVTAISRLRAAPGRMEVVVKRPLVIVDYAHTPDALEKALMTLKGFQTQTKAGSLWVVFGCGGDRDPYKRPEMGKIACTLADKVVVTSDNPRHENPIDIMEQIMQGMPESFVDKFAIEDRRLAIMSALQEAKEDDIILIAGKGHENYQQIGDKKTYFSDQHIVLDYFSHTTI